MNANAEEIRNELNRFKTLDFQNLAFMAGVERDGKWKKTPPFDPFPLLLQSATQAIHNS